jgi:hypothetical protein
LTKCKIYTEGQFLEFVNGKNFALQTEVFAKFELIYTFHNQDIGVPSKPKYSQHAQTSSSTKAVEIHQLSHVV